MSARDHHSSISFEADLVGDTAALQAMLAAERVENKRLRKIIRELQRHRFGRRAESLPPDQLHSGLKKRQAEAADEAKAQASGRAHCRVAKRQADQGSLPRHLQRIEIVVVGGDQTCPCCAAPSAPR